jgi:hypothetical protein
MNDMRKTLVELKKRIHNPFYFERNHNISNTVLYAGSGRGGTTWISEIINFNNQYRYMFEPLNADYIKQFEHFKKRQYLRADEKNEAYTDPIKKMLEGHMKHYWIDQFNKKIIVDKRLIKVIRGNLLLGFISHNFPEVKLLLSIRHPFAVANSQLKRRWEPDLEKFYLQQPNLLEDYISLFVTNIKNAETTFERSMIMWCIDNYVPLKQLDEHLIKVIFYEDLVLNPESELESLCKFLGNNYDKKVFSVLRRPSKMSGDYDVQKNGIDIINGWKEKTSEKDFRAGNDILRAFGLDKLYNEDSTPNHTMLKNFRSVAKNTSNKIIK